MAALALTACTDEADTPDTSTPPSALVPTSAATVPPFADCSGESPVDPCVIPTDAPTPATPAAATEPPTPPVTCGPDPDETHPPPCD